MSPEEENRPPKRSPACSVCRRDLAAGVAHFVFGDRATCLDCHEAERRILRRLDDGSRAAE
jgi:hypothetical protein